MQVTDFYHTVARDVHLCFKRKTKEQSEELLDPRVKTSRESVNYIPMSDAKALFRPPSPVIRVVCNTLLSFSDRLTPPVNYIPMSAAKALFRSPGPVSCVVCKTLLSFSNRLTPGGNSPWQYMKSATSHVLDSPANSRPFFHSLQQGLPGPHCHTRPQREILSHLTLSTGNTAFGRFSMLQFISCTAL